MTPIPDYDALIAAFKARADEIGLSTMLLDELTGLPAGYVGKLFGPSRVKMIGLDSLWLLSEALALEISVAPSLALAQKMEARWEARDELRRRPGVIRKRFSPELKARAISEAARERINVLNMRTLPEDRSASARRAAVARWKKISKRDRKAIARALVAARRKRRASRGPVARAADTSPATAPPSVESPSRRPQTAGTGERTSPARGRCACSRS